MSMVDGSALLLMIAVVSAFFCAAPAVAISVALNKKRRVDARAGGGPFVVVWIVFTRMSSVILYQWIF